MHSHFSSTRSIYTSEDEADDSRNQAPAAMQIRRNPARSKFEFLVCLIQIYLPAQRGRRGWLTGVTIMPAKNVAPTIDKVVKVKSSGLCEGSLVNFCLRILFVGAPTGKPGILLDHRF